MVLSLANFFLQVLQQKELVSMAKAQRDNSKAQTERNQKLFDAGALRADILNNLKAQLANDELNVVNAENALQLAKVNLQLLMMLKVTDNFEIQAPKPGVENYTRALAAGIDELFKESVSRNPQIKGAEFREKAADYGVKIAQAGHYPRLNLFGNLNTLWSDSRKSSIPGSTVLQVFPIGFVGNSLDTVFAVQGVPRFRTTAFGDQLSDNLGTTVGLGLTIPIFSQGQIRNSVRRANTNRELAKLNMEQQKNSLYQDIARAFTDFKATMLRHQANQENLKAQKEAYQFSTARFEQGMLNSADYLLAKNNAQRAEAALIQSQYELMFREKILEFYRGGKVDIND
jgi:outer membrane protein